MVKAKEIDEIMSQDPIEDAKEKGKKLRSSSFKRLIDKMEGWKPAPQVLQSVRAVPTVFPGYDWVNGVGGHPLERVTVVIGPSNNGKSAFVLGLAKSFVQGLNPTGYMDAEFTTTIDWARALMTDVADHPLFFAMRPNTFEEAVEATTRFCKGVAESREAGDLPDTAGGLVIVDSLRKLVPEKIMKLIASDDLKQGVDGQSGRAGQIRALYNAAWLDILVPLMASTGCSVVLIAREVDDPDADPWEKKTGQDFKVTGGKSLIFESSLLIRVTRAAWVTDGKKKDEGGDGKIYGEKHRITIHKTKIAGKTEKKPSAFFHTSSGVLVPAGFDHARDVVELGLKFGIIEQSGSWYSFDGDKLGQGLNQVVSNLTEVHQTCDAIEERIRAEFDKHEVEEEDGASE